VDLVTASPVDRISSVDLHLWRRLRSCRSGHKHSLGQAGLSLPCTGKAVTTPGTTQLSPSGGSKDDAGSTQIGIRLIAACWQASAVCWWAPGFWAAFRGEWGLTQGCASSPQYF